MNHDASSTPQGWVSEKELARHLHISLRHLVNLRRRGLPYIALGKCVRYDLAEVEAFIRANRRLASHVERQKRRAALVQA
jgi:hypothetical protein